MSRYSGVCDLADHLSGLGGWYDKHGNKVTLGQEDVGVYYSDEMKDFLAFKEKTKGVIHQHKKVVVSTWNQEDVKEHCKGFEILKHEKVSKDNRFKNKERKETYYTYIYWGKEYPNLKELNKHGVYITIDIHFDTLLDLIPYYPYVVSACACSENKHYIVISSNPSYIERRDDSLKHGGRINDSWQYYTKTLQEHYRDVILRYFNPQGHEYEEYLEFKEWKEDDEWKDKYIAFTSHAINTNFPVKWNTNKAHWTSPKVLDAFKGVIEMSKEDYLQFLGSACTVNYVEYQEPEICLC